MTNIRIANRSDIKDIFDWANDENTRQMSHTTDLVDWDEHNVWFNSSLIDPSRLLLICEDENLKKKIAVVRFDVDGERAVVSINVSPNMRGKGKAKECLKDAISSFKTIFSSVRFIDAEIKSLNVASKRSFVAVGFEFVKKDSDLLFYEYAI